ncbi:hypothetical protein BHM03_00032049 [Ensete ventricosum]|nr:hypothetical protein BHM03_00032049 [Ensete ventricosum]
MSHRQAVTSPRKEREAMSMVPKETIEVIAQSIGIANLSPDVALALAPDVEYRLREIMQVLHKTPPLFPLGFS